MSHNPELKTLAQKHMNSGQYTQALPKWNQLLSMKSDDNDHLELLFQRSKCLLHLEKYKLALEDAQKMVELAPNSVCGYLRQVIRS